MDGYIGNMDTSSLFDIIIVNYNSTDYLFECLKTVFEALGDLPATVYVEDNASHDSPERILESFPSVRLHCNSRNIGFAAAVNQAIRRGSAPHVVLLNPDSLMDSRFFQNLISFVASNPDVGVIGPRILDGDGSVQGSARAFPTPLTAFFGRKSLFTRLFPNNRITSANVLTSRCDGINPMCVDWVSGACMIVRRRAIDQVGLLDERFFMYWEDADWCRRMWDAGWKVLYYPLSTVVHYVGVSSDQLMIRSLYEFHKSVYLLFDKYNKPSPWILKPLIMAGLFLRLCFVTISGCLHLWVSRSRWGSIRKLSKQPKPDERIRVLRMIARLNIGGPAIHVHLLTTRMNPLTFQTLLVTGSISSQEGDMSYLFEDDDNKPLVIPELQRDISLLLDIQAMFRIFRILNRFRPHIVDTHTAKAGFSARFAVLIYNVLFRQHVSIVHTFHGHVFEGYFSRAKSRMFVWIERQIARLTNVIIAISPIQRQELVERYRIAPASKVRTIELGFDLTPFIHCREKAGVFRQQLRVDERTVLIGIVGRLVPIKHHELFLNAAARLKARWKDRDLRFVIVGDGECRNELERRVRQMGLSEQVVFSGWIRDIPSVYADLDILALTSLNEGTPFSIIEAMAARVPVVATCVGGVPDLLGTPNLPIFEGEFAVCDRGLLCRSNDPEGFCRALLFVLNETGETREHRISNARDYAVHRYSEDRLLRDIERLYLELMGRTIDSNDL